MLPLSLLIIPIWQQYFRTACWESVKQPHLAIMTNKILGSTDMINRGQGLQGPVDERPAALQYMAPTNLAATFIYFLPFIIITFSSVLNEILQWYVSCSN